MTCLIAPSLPAASMAWNTSSSDQRSCAYSMSCKFGERLDAGLQRLLGARLVFLLEPRGIARIDVLEPEPVPVLDSVGLGELAR